MPDCSPLRRPCQPLGPVAPPSWPRHPRGSRPGGEPCALLNTAAIWYGIPRAGAGSRPNTERGRTSWRAARWNMPPRVRICPACAEGCPPSLGTRGRFLWGREPQVRSLSYPSPFAREEDKEGDDSLAGRGRPAHNDRAAASPRAGCPYPRIDCAHSFLSPHPSPAPAMCSSRALDCPPAAGYTLECGDKHSNPHRRLVQHVKLTWLVSHADRRPCLP